MRGLLLCAVCAVVLVWAAPAQAASNACNFSVDDYWTSIDVSITGAAAPATDVLPGDTLTLTGAKASAVLPAYMAMLGYNFGILKAGENVIPVKVWLALRATNTFEQTQLLGPIAVEARTTITAAPDGTFASATPITYEPPALAETTWSAAGGDVALSQAPAGAIPQRLPIGPNDALRSVNGSLVILADLSPVRFSMDCQPGAGNDTGTGPIVGAPVPFDTRPGPLNQSCEDGTFRGVKLTGPTLSYAAGVPFTLSGVRGSRPARVTIRATGTVEGSQTVETAGEVLPDTVWTPAGSGPIAFSQAAGLGSVMVGTVRCGLGVIRDDGTLREHPAPPVFATATVSPPPPPPPVVVEPPVVVPIVTPPPAPVAKPKAGVVRVRSSRLTLKRGKAKLQLACSKAGPCTGTLKVLGRSRSYSIAAGRTKTYTLTLRTRAARVRVVLTPASGRTVTKTIRLRRT